MHLGLAETVPFLANQCVNVVRYLQFMKTLPGIVGLCTIIVVCHNSGMQLISWYAGAFWGVHFTQQLIVACFFEVYAAIHSLKEASSQH